MGVTAHPTLPGVCVAAKVGLPPRVVRHDREVGWQLGGGVPHLVGGEVELRARQEEWLILGNSNLHLIVGRDG